jgi:hypothetical protein
MQSWTSGTAATFTVWVKWALYNVSGTFLYLYIYLPYVYVCIYIYIYIYIYICVCMCVCVCVRLQKGFSFTNTDCFLQKTFANIRQEVWNSSISSPHKFYCKIRSVNCILFVDHLRPGDNCSFQSCTQKQASVITLEPNLLFAPRHMFSHIQLMLISTPHGQSWTTFLVTQLMIH